MITRFSQLDFTDLWTFVVFPLFPLACWIIYLFLALRKKPALPAETRSEVPWGAIDVVAVLGSMLFAKFLAQVCSIFLISWKTGLPLDQINQSVALENANILIGCGIVFSLLQMVLVIGYLKKFQGSTWADLGFDREHLKRHIAVGLVAAIMVIPLVLLLNIVLHVLLKVEYSHQVMTMVRFSILTTALSTIIIAPLVEEFHFRVVLQGCLQRVYNMDFEKKLHVIQGDKRAEKLMADKKSSASKSRDQEKKPDTQTKIPYWPILISSLLFASVHMGQGAAPYALFVLALFLGFLYRQTNSIIPGILVHLLLNLWSFVALVYSLD